jgi:hypothetical protein
VAGLTPDLVNKAIAIGHEERTLPSRIAYTEALTGAARASTPLRMHEISQQAQTTNLHAGVTMRGQDIQSRLGELNVGLEQQRVNIAQQQVTATTMHQLALKGQIQADTEKTKLAVDMAKQAQYWNDWDRGVISQLKPMTNPTTFNQDYQENMKIVLNATPNTAIAAVQHLLGGEMQQKMQYARFAAAAMYPEVYYKDEAGANAATQAVLQKIIKDPEMTVRAEITKAIVSSMGLQGAAGLTQVPKIVDDLMGVVKPPALAVGGGVPAPDKTGKTLKGFVNGRAVYE